MAATVPVEKAGDSSPLLEQAMQVGDFADTTTGTDTAVLDRPEKPKVAEARVGSYEAFMSSFGTPARWAGR